MTSAPARAGEPRAGEIPALLKRFGIEPKRGLSQNFLVSDDALEAIADACGASGAHALEIGAGPATLTRALARRARRVTAFEIDGRFRPLHQEFPLPENVRVVYGDFLAADLAALLVPGEPAVIAGNIPYAITGLLFRRALDPALPVRRVSLLVQEEAARRVVGAQPGDRGALSVAAWLFGDARIERIVQPGSFHPRPKVRSALVAVERAARDLRGIPPDRFMKFARDAYAARRKTLAGNLAHGDPALRERIRALAGALGHPADARAERFTPPDLVALCRALEGDPA